MLGAKPSVQVRSALRSLEADGPLSLCPRSAPHMHGQADPHPHVRRPAQRHAFAPIPRRTAALLPAPRVMGTQDSSFNVQLHRAATRSSFAPAAAAFHHPATQTPFGSPKGRWAALHVHIAWKIYYNKTLQKRPQKSNGVYGTMTPECPPGSGLLPDSEPGNVSDQPPCTHPDPECPCAVRSDVGQTAHRFSRCASPPAPGHRLPTTQREDVIQHRQEKPGGKDKCTGHQADTGDGAPLRDASRDQRAPADRQGGSLNRKRQSEHKAFIPAKRFKTEPLDDKLDSSKTFPTEPSWFSMSYTHPSALTTPVHHRHVGHLSLFYPSSSTALGGPLSCPGPEIGAYPMAPRELLWNRREHLHSRHAILEETALRPAETFGGFFMPPLYLLPALGAQEPSYLGGRELPHAENCHPHPCRSQLPHPSFLTTSC